MTVPEKVGPFFIGNWYETLGGKPVQIVGSATKILGYETVIGSDGAHRYARSTSQEDWGRVTGSSHDFTHPENIPGFRVEEEGSDLRKTVGLVLEGWTIPSTPRKILEAAYFAEGGK